MIGRRGFGVAGRVDVIDRERQAEVFVGLPSASPAGTYTFTSFEPLVERRDVAIDLSAAYTLPTSDGIRIRLCAGPTYFHVTEHLVSGVQYTQVAAAGPRQSSVTIKSVDTAATSTSIVGVHVAADIAVFFHRYMGIGLALHYTHKTATLTDPLTDAPVEIAVGHTQAGVGLRFRF